MLYSLLWPCRLPVTGKLGILRTKFLLGALHAIEASGISFTLLQKLRSAFVSAVWSKKMPLAHVGAVLTLLDGPPGCDPGFFVVWCRFRLLRRYLAYRPLEAPRIFKLLGLVAAGKPGFGPIHLLVGKANALGFIWDPLNSGWIRPGLPLLHQLAGPYQHFKAAIWEAWQAKVSFDLCRRQGFRGGPMLDIAGSLQLLHAPHVRERDKALLRSIMVGGVRVWNGFLLGHARGDIVPCRFCGGFDGDGHLFWECSHPPLVQIRENPEFHDLIQRNKRTWPRCLHWHGWLPALGCDEDWAVGVGGSVSRVLETKLGGYSPFQLDGLVGSEEFVSGTTFSQPAANPDVWTDGRLVRDDVAGFCCGGAGVYCCYLWEGLEWTLLGALGVAST